MGPTGSITGPQSFALLRGRPVDPRRDHGRPRHARLDADRQLRRHARDPGPHRHAQHRLHVGFRPHRGPDRARRDDRSRCSRAWRQRQDFVNTVFDDSAATSITRARPPSPGPSCPHTTSTRPRSPACGKSADGTWTLQITNTSTGATSTLDTWSLNITPTITVTPVASTETSRSTASPRRWPPRSRSASRSSSSAAPTRSSSARTSRTSSATRWTPPAARAST